MSETGTAGRMTVLQVVPALESGGVERGTLEIAAALAERGHRSMVISAGGRLVGQLEAEGSEHVGWPIGRKSLWTLGYVRKLRKLMREEGVDIVHARSRVPGWVAYLAWRGMGEGERPGFVTTVHSLYSVSGYSGVMTRGERVIAISRTVERYIEKNYPRTDKGKVRLIYRGVNPVEFPPGHRPSEAWRGRWLAEYPQLGDGGVVLTLPGRLVRRKGHLDFMSMLGRLKAGGLRFHGLVVGGEDPNRLNYAREVREAVRAHGVEGEVIFTGDRREMAEIYAVSDIVYCLSAEPAEAFGRTVVEALTIGTPVIGYDLGGVGETLGELLPEGRVGVHDVEGAAERTLAFLANRPPIRENREFTLEAMIGRTLGVYEELMAERRVGV